MLTWIIETGNPASEIELIMKDTATSPVHQMDFFFERGPSIPVGISARHVHLSAEHLEVLFGVGHQLRIKKELSQPGQFAAEDTVMLAGPKGVIEKVRILGPPRQQTQVEVAITDTFRLGVSPPVRDSGDLMGSSDITIIGPKGSIYLPEGLIIAGRHIHMSEKDEQLYKVQDGDQMLVLSQSERPVLFSHVKIRVSPHYCLEFHIDTDEANAAKLNSCSRVHLLKKNEFPIIQGG